MTCFSAKLTSHGSPPPTFFQSCYPLLFTLGLTLTILAALGSVITLMIVFPPLLVIAALLIVIGVYRVLSALFVWSISQGIDYLYDKWMPDSYGRI